MAARARNRRANDATQPGNVFMAFCFREAAANLLTVHTSPDDRDDIVNSPVDRETAGGLSRFMLVAKKRSVHWIALSSNLAGGGDVPSGRFARGLRRLACGLFNKGN